MYDAQYFFVANPLNRYTLSARNKLKAERDGTVELLIQASNPGPDKEANWLPAPNGPFVLILRLYWPKENPPSLLDGTWKPPPSWCSTEALRLPEGVRHASRGRRSQTRRLRFRWCACRDRQIRP